MTDRPELMAIGDSIYNGTRSLTTNAEMAGNAVPVQVARAFGWSFNTPTYPFDVLFNLETLFRANDFNLDQLKASVIANAQAWLDLGQWAEQDCFDNIALAQSAIADQSGFTWLNHESRIAPLLAELRGASGIDFEVLIALYEAINVSFVLNPRRDPSSPWADKTPLEIIGLRKPKRLLVNIGINDGIWTICLLATKDEFQPDQIGLDMRGLGERLRDLKATGAIDQIYFNLLPKPSCVANLMPRRDPDALPAGKDYFPEYLGRLGQLGGLTGDELKALDQDVRELNEVIREDLTELFAPAGGIAFVDVFGKMESRDDKHFRDAAPIWIGNRRMNNVPLQGFSHKGGLFGLDNLHPSTVGYAVLAEAVCAQIQAVEGLQPVAPIDFEAAFNRDSLLTNIPPMLDVSNLLINFVVALAGLFARPGV